MIKERERGQLYRRRNPERLKILQKARHTRYYNKPENRAHCLEYMKKPEVRIRQNMNLKRLRREWKLEVLTHYSKGVPHCNCCDEYCIDFLSIDHINGDGNKQRKTLKMTGIAFYRWLKRNNYPDGFQILCYNCNMAKGFLGVCPHKVKQW